MECLRYLFLRSLLTLTMVLFIAAVQPQNLSMLHTLLNVTLPGIWSSVCLWEQFCKHKKVSVILILNSISVVYISKCLTCLPLPDYRISNWRKENAVWACRCPVTSMEHGKEERGFPPFINILGHYTLADRFRVFGRASSLSRSRDGSGIRCIHTCPANRNFSRHYLNEH